MSTAIDNHIHGTGKVRIGAVGGTLTDANDALPVVASLSLEVNFQVAKLYNTPQISKFAIDSAHYDGVLMVKISGNGIEREVMRKCLGGALTTADGKDTIAIGATSSPEYVRLEADLVDTNGKAFKVIVPRAKAPGLTIAFTRADWANQTVEFEAFQLSGQDVATIVIDQ